MNIDVTLVAGSRPCLLRRTLESFSENLLCNFSLQRVVANVDPIFGPPAQQQECADLISSYFPEAFIFQPSSPSFGMAIKRTWEATTQDLIFHMEDDWLLLEAVTPSMIVDQIRKGVSGIKPVAREHRWRGNDPRISEKPILKLGRLELGIQKRPVRFGTSPGFFAGAFARGFAAKLDPALDPEKQVKEKYNRDIARYCEQFRFVYLPGNTSRELIQDIGRAWRDSHNIIKEVADGRSVWRQNKECL